MSAVELRGGTHFLLLHRLANEAGHEVEAVARFDDVVSRWREFSRTSPIFSLNGAPVPVIPRRGKIWIVFFGSFFPGLLDGLRIGDVYLSLGLMNMVAFCRTDAERRRVLKLATENGCFWEQWEVKGGRLNKVSSQIPKASGVAFPKDFSRPLPKNLTRMLAANREYLLLLKSSYSRARIFAPDLAQELEDFDRIVRGILNDPEIEAGFKHGLLVNTNAYLSRQTDQTYAGTPPILENDIQFWPHSLLGVGTGSVALLRVRQFVSRAFEKAGLIARLKALESREPHQKALHQVAPGDAYWQRDQLAAREFGAGPKSGAAGSEPVDVRAEPVIPHITCFSGRDGFRSTDVSLSAPQELLTSCNTPRWTLLTLTHEISHVLISGVLGVLLPSPDDEEGLSEVVSAVGTDSARNLLDQVKSLVAFSIWQMDPEASRRDLDENVMALLIERHWREVNEILTHCFDFLYFYRKNAQQYVSSLWTSWEVIPNIRERIPDYLVRTLCALHTKNLERENGLNTSISQLLKGLTELSGRLKNVNYVKKAAEELQGQRKKYRDLLGERERFVRIVRGFLYSAEVEKILAKEWLLGAGDHGGYPMRPLEFGTERIQNPLRFVETFCCDEEPNTPKSVWMLHHIAFGGAP